MCFIAAAIFFLLFAIPAEAAPLPCDALHDAMAHAPAGPVFLPSFPKEKDGPLHNTAFLYDNAAAALALIGCGSAPDAARIGDAMLTALDHDRYWHDGRLRNAYAAGAPEKPVKLAGWWHKQQNRWVEDQYQEGSDSGNMAWAMLALLALYRAGHEARYRHGAVRIAHWLEGNLDTRAPPGFVGGTFGDQPNVKHNRWKSTEHNADLAAAFTQLAGGTHDTHWRSRAKLTEDFVLTMWDSVCSCFDAGMAEDSITRNRTLSLDAQLWPVMAIASARVHADAALATALRRLSFKGGMAYGAQRDGQWTEGTEQAALLMKLTGKPAQARALMLAAEKNRTPDGWYFAADRQTSTGFDLQTDLTQHRSYFHTPALAPLAWAALAQTGFNPFTATRSLPH